MTPQEKTILLVLATINFTHILDFMIMMPLGPQFIQSFGIGTGQFGFLVSSYGLASFIFGLVGAPYLDHFDRRTALLWLYSGFIAATVACALAFNFESMLVARFLAGSTGGLLSSVVLSVVGDICPEERRATGMGWVMAGFSAATVAGVPIGLFLAHRLGWKAPFAGVALVSLLVLWAIYKYVPSLTKHIKPIHERPAGVDWSVFQRALSEKNQILALLFTLLVLMGQFMVIPNIANSLTFNNGFNEETLSLVYLLGGGLTIFTAPLIGRLADKYGKSFTFFWIGLASIVPLWLVTNLPPTGYGIVLMVTSIFLVLISGRGIPATSLVVSAVPAWQRGSFMSIRNSVAHLGTFLATALSGVLVWRNPYTGRLEGYENTGYIAIGMTILAIILASSIKAVDDK